MADQYTAPLLTWREEARRDRLARAQIDQAREAARVQGRIAGREAAGRIRREAAEARRARRAMAAAARAARFAALGAWAAAHVTDLLFVPVIAVPAMLAWTAMAAYGASLYGTPGRALPAFSEGAMWAFAAAVTITCHRHPGRPVWHLRLGTGVFAVFGAVLNFAHGLTAGGPVAGAAMALVSVAGVTAHQLVTAGPRRSRADREAARLTRVIGRRERAARRAAIRRALVDLDEDGSARLVFEPGAAVLGRHFGRVRLVPVLGPAPEPVPESAPGSAPGPALAGAPETAPETVPGPAPETAPGAVSETAPADTPQPAPETAPADTPRRTARRAPKRTRPAATKPNPEVHFAAALAAGELPSARRIRSELHVGQPKAQQIRARLAAAMAGTAPAEQ